GPWFYSWVATKGYFRNYMRNPVRLELEIDGRITNGVTALAQNSDPFTYFGKQPVHVCENVEIDDGALGLILLKRANLLDMGMVVPRLLTQKLRAARHGQVEAFEHFTEARIRSGSRDESGELMEFPVQVDGDYIGTFAEVSLEAAPGALTIVA
ncbi:MAG: hypothetical protein KDB64_12590, partial [Solirubrobacterales bacterium]|nr:hypothetical protein [Solirubrobacterales bacterium]